MKKVFILFFFAAISFPVFAQSIVGAGKAVDPYHYNSVKSVTFSKAAVASAHPLASAVGVEIMKEGGNAFDAMIATQLTLAVVYPGAGNIGGGGFLMARKADGKLVALDYREMAPGKAAGAIHLATSRSTVPWR